MLTDKDKYSVLKFYAKNDMHNHVSEMVKDAKYWQYIQNQHANDITEFSTQSNSFNTVDFLLQRKIQALLSSDVLVKTDNFYFGKSANNRQLTEKYLTYFPNGQNKNFCGKLYCRRNKKRRSKEAVI